MNCNQCQYTDVCKSATAQHELIKPLTQRGDKPECFECGHVYWIINHTNHTARCDTCKIIEPISDSVKIKHQR